MLYWVTVWLQYILVLSLSWEVYSVTIIKGSVLIILLVAQLTLQLIMTRILILNSIANILNFVRNYMTTMLIIVFNVLNNLPSNNNVTYSLVFPSLPIPSTALTVKE